METDQHPSSLSLRNRKPWLFRLAAIGFGLALIGIFELGLRVAGIGRRQEFAAPMVEFSDIRPLFAKNEAGDRFEIPKYRQVFFQPESFDAKKAGNEYRIFCFGGSTVQGRPYSIETSFTTWLELNLKAAQPEVSWEAVNCGGVSYASYRLVPIMRESLQYKPDLFLVYTGHNEFLEERTYSGIKRQPKWMRNLQDQILQFRIAGAMTSLFPLKPTSKTVNLPAEVDALLDYQGGLAKYTRDDPGRDAVVYEYEQNLLAMVEIAKTANVPLLLMNPVSNVRNTAPFKVEAPKHFTETERVDFALQWEAAKEATWDNLAEKEETVRAVLELDGRHAEAWFLLAKVLEARGKFADAKQAYLRAKDEDICPLRMLESMHRVLIDVAKQTNTPLIDIRHAFEQSAEHQIPGDDQLIDHVHPRIEGHQKIADLVFRHLQEREIVRPALDWQTRKEQLYKLNYQSLPDNYFPESVERLRGLKKWASGRVTRLKINP